MTDGNALITPTTHIVLPDEEATLRAGAELARVVETGAIRFSQWLARRR